MTQAVPGTLILPRAVPTADFEAFDSLSLNERRRMVVDAILQGGRDDRLEELLNETIGSLYNAYERGLHHWIVTYSGGKDSTTVLVVALEILRHADVLGWGPQQVDVVFSDTLLEIPPLVLQARQVLDHVNQLAEQEDLPVRTHVVIPEIKDRFWFCILGKGYPPPHNRFRWCTDRLKIKPSETIIKRATHDAPGVLLTGVRYGESDARTGRLNVACTQSGECGQGVWFDRSERLNTDYLAPIASWTTCKVWDFLTWVAPQLGWPTAELAALYGDDPIRFGCWTCPLVKEDRATATVVQREEWRHLAPLLDFRNLLITIGRSREPNDRLLRSDGKVGKLSLERRQELYRALRAMEEQINMTLLDPAEAAAIEAYWKTQECQTEITQSQAMWAQRATTRLMEQQQEEVRP